MSPDLDRESAHAVDALVFRLRNRGDGDRQFAIDDELFAREYVTAMRGRGWRPTEARTPWDYRALPHAGGHPESEEALALVEQARRDLEEARARQHATRRRLTLEPPTGDAA
jgi:hypothetical protein